MAAPVFDQRNASEFFVDALALARLYCSRWALPDNGAVTPEAIAQDPGLALLRLFSLLGQDLANVLNAIPVQRQLALYGFLGMTLRPAVCASAPVCFSLVAKHASVFLPKGTVIVDSATPRTYFETDDDLQVLPATLCAALTVEPRRDRYWDVQSIWGAGDAAPAFPGAASEELEQALAHCLLVGDAALFQSAPPGASMSVTLSGERLDPERFQRWYDGALNPLQVTVQGSADGRLCTIAFPNVPTSVALPVAALHAAISARAGRTLDMADPAVAVYPSTPLSWLVCESGDGARVIPALAGCLPRIDTLRCDFGMLSVLPSQASVNGIAVDLKNGALPFGKAPAAYDTFSIRCDAAFAQPGARIAIEIDAATLASTPSAVLEWQFWNGAWNLLNDTANGNPYQFVDDTQNLTTKGTIWFICPQTLPTSVAGNKGVWIRAVLSSGDYGNAKSGFRPPFVHSLTIRYPSGGVPSSVYAHNAFTLDILAAAPYEPYRPPVDEGAAFYLGFDAADLLAYGLEQRLSLYVDVDPADEHIGHRDAGQWQWFDASLRVWRPLTIALSEAGLARSGSVAFDVPGQLQLAVLFSQTACWFRVLCPRLSRSVHLRGVYSNAVLASNRSTYRNVVLGAGNGQPSQQLRLNRVSTAASGHDQVLFATSADPDYAIALQVLEPANPESVALFASQAPLNTAYMWERVDSFAGYGPNDRVFTVDVATGTLTFGDGKGGKIPPPGSNNIIAACYATTRGSAGNVAAGALTTLYVATDGIAQVTNPVAASGGADADSVNALIDIAPGLVRANNRAVTVADVEALAASATAGIRRVRAIEHTFSPAFQLVATEIPVMPPLSAVGRTTPDGRTWPRLELVVLAASSDPEPLTPMSMLDDALAYVRARSAPALAARLTARRPAFKRVDAAALLQTNAPKSQWPALQAALSSQLIGFLHPAQGGTAARGWPIGEPLRYALVHNFLLAFGDAVTAVVALSLCGQSNDVALAPHEVPSAGAVEIRLTEAARS